MSPSATVLASARGKCRRALTVHRCSPGELRQLALTTLQPDRVFLARNRFARNSSWPHTALDSGAAQSRMLVPLLNSGLCRSGRLTWTRALVTNLGRSRRLPPSHARRLQGRTQDLPSPYREKRNSRLSPHTQDQNDRPFRSLSDTSVWRIQGFGAACDKKVGGRASSSRRLLWLLSGRFVGHVDHPSLALL